MEWIMLKTPPAEAILAVEGSALGRLLGPARSRVLVSLSRPKTTREVAADLGLAASTTSEHLRVLADAGVAARTRIGRRVYYRQTVVGQRLVSMFVSTE
jgi:DNA-binding transcriptional ArsR family regulator